MSLKVTLFSDPMVDALSRLVDKDNRNYYFIDGSGKKKHGQYIPIPGIYILLISNLIINFSFSFLLIVYCHTAVFQC